MVRNSGGIEEGETFLEACKREASEEAGISQDSSMLELQSISTIHVPNITKDFIWRNDIGLVYEHCFGIDATKEKSNYPMSIIK